MVCDLGGQALIGNVKSHLGPADWKTMANPGWVSALFRKYGHRGHAAVRSMLLAFRLPLGAPGLRHFRPATRSFQRLATTLKNSPGTPLFVRRIYRA
jgi:hypothetical protein